MKVIRFYLLAIFLTITSIGYAQFTNASSKSSYSGGGSDGWVATWAEYNPIKLELSNVERSLSGYSVGASYAFGVSQSSPLLLEAGVGIQYASGTDSKYAYSTIDLFSLKVPVNFLYGIEMSDGRVTLYPFAGITFRYNFTSSFYSNNDTLDMFDDLDGNRFQPCWQLGAKVLFAEYFMIGVSFGSDLTEIAEDANIRTTSILIGYTF